MKLSKLFNDELGDHRKAAPYAEADFTTDCEQCGDAISLSDCRRELDARGTVYHCGKCHDVVVILTPAKDRGRTDGYPFGDYLIRNPRDLRVARAGQTFVIDGNADFTIDR